MALEQRLFGPILSSVGCETVFAGTDEAKRMELVREKIYAVRSKWGNDEYYDELKRTLKKHLQLGNQPVGIQKPVKRLLQGFNDYADADFARSSKTTLERYSALELYCSQDGYKCLYSIISKVLRTRLVNDDLLTTAVTLVEYLTIDLYNLRLSNLGDPRYNNYEGITYRGLRVTTKALSDYREVASRENLAQRNFSIPLGLMSSTSDSKVMEQFAEGENDYPNLHRMHWTIHIHGIDEGLLRGYLNNYPDSVVTSICALPVARLSPFGEKEILLRGAFFQVIHMETGMVNGYQAHRLVLVMINANRDHATELGSNVGDKQSQRAAFNRAVMASKYRICASLTAQYSAGNAEKYKQLYYNKLDEIRRIDGVNIETPLDLNRRPCKKPATWLGGSVFSSYPRPYRSLRRQWQDAIGHGQWRDVEKILAHEYDWCQSDWFNVAKLSDGKEPVQRSGYTVLHELAMQSPSSKSEEEEFKARRRISKVLTAPGIWKTLRTFDVAAKTAQQLAQEGGETDIAVQLQPQIENKIPPEILEQLECKLHKLMRDKAGELVAEHVFRMPQLSVLEEMEYPGLWIPIPHMYGGFEIHLDNGDLHVKTYETIVGQTRPRTSCIKLVASPSSIHC